MCAGADAGECSRNVLLAARNEDAGRMSDNLAVVISIAHVSCTSAPSWRTNESIGVMFDLMNPIGAGELL
jgi:hypothetical protein